MRYSKCLTQFYLFCKGGSYFSWVKNKEYVLCKPYPAESNTIYTDAELKAIWFLDQEKIINFAVEIPDWRYRYYRLRKHVLGEQMYEIK